MHLAHGLPVGVSAGFWVSVRSVSRVLGPADPSSLMAGGEACVLTQESPIVCVYSWGAGLELCAHPTMWIFVPGAAMNCKALPDGVPAVSEVAFVK